MKRTHVEIIVAEQQAKKDDTQQKTDATHAPSAKKQVQKVQQ